MPKQSLRIPQVLPTPLAALKKRRQKLSACEERNNRETVWQQAAEFCNPNDSDIKRTSNKGGRRVIKRVVDTGIECTRGFSKGMYAYAVGTGRFFSIRPRDKELQANDEVVKHFEKVVRIMFEELHRSNFATEIQQGFGELGYIGTTNTYSEYYADGLNFRTQHISAYWIDVDVRGFATRVFVSKRFNAEQINDEWFSEARGNPNPVPSVIAADIAAGNHDKEYEVIQATFENTKHVDGSILPEQKRYVSVYYLNDQPELLYIEGHDTFPFHVARLYKTKNEVYGRSCYDECEKSLSLLNDERLTLIRGGKNRADPPWVQAADARVRHIHTNEIHKVIYDPTSLGGEPKQADIRSDVGITEHMIEIDTEYVKRAFYINAFNPLLDQKNMTATEAMERIDLGLSETTPLTVKWIREFLEGMMRRCYELLEAKGKFGDPPTILENKEMQFEFVSKSALALKQLERYGIINSYEKASFVAKFQPEILDNFDVDAIARIGAEADNVASLILREKKDVEKIRKGRAKQAELDRMAQTAPPLADAAHKVSQIKGDE